MEQINTRPLGLDTDFMWGHNNTLVTMWMNQFGTIPSFYEKTINIEKPSIERFNKICESVRNELVGLEFEESDIRYEHSSYDEQAIDDGTYMSTDDEFVNENDAPILLRTHIFTVYTRSAKHPRIVDYVVIGYSGTRLTIIHDCTDYFSTGYKDRIKDAFISNEDKVTRSPSITMIQADDVGFSLIKLPIREPNDFSYEELYNDDFKPIGENIERFIEDKSSGIVILHGKHGTGKTTFIRHLIYNHNKRFVYMPVEVANRLSSPSFISFIKDNLKDTIIVLEDCENLIRDRKRSLSPDSSIINILNMSDGLLGDSLKIKFICTFNSPFDDIDTALTRKGRMVERYEFKELSKEKTAALIKKRVDSCVNYTGNGMTLSDIFNMKAENHADDNNKKRIGF